MEPHRGKIAHGCEKTWMKKAAGLPGIFCVNLSDQSDPAHREYIHEQIRAFNDDVSEHHRAVRQSGPRPLDITIRDEQGRPAGGLTARTYWTWLEIEDLWLPKALRGRGFGRELLAAAEAEALVRGCARAMVQTFSFQARGFYERCGYRVVGRLDDYPPGHAFFWMEKDLLPAGHGGG